MYVGYKIKHCQIQGSNKPKFKRQLKGWYKISGWSKLYKKAILPMIKSFLKAFTNSKKLLNELPLEML